MQRRGFYRASKRQPLQLLTLLLLATSGCARVAAPDVVPRVSPPATRQGPASSTNKQARPLPPIATITAPFAMPPLQRPPIPAATFDVRNYGAVADGTTKNTAAFASAIAAAVDAGGGRVLVPAGRWLTGPVHLQSNIELHVSEGAELLFSPDFADYLPPVFTRWEGLEVFNYSPLIYARNCINVAVTGRGKLNGQGQAWWPWKQTQHKTAKQLYELATRNVPVEQRVLAVEGGLRPSFIQTVGCVNVLVEGVTISDGPMWTIHPLYSENVIVRDVRVLTNGPNNDGCNPDSSRNVLIEDSFFSTGDDCVVIKSGLNEDGWRVGKPSENIVVRRLRGERGHGGVVIGSEMSGGVRNVYVHDSDFVGTDRGLRIKSMRGRGGVVENIYYHNVRHQDLRLMVVEMTTFYASSTLIPQTLKAPTIRNVHISDIKAEGARQAMEIVGLPESPLQNIFVQRVAIHSETGVRCTNCADLRFTDVSVQTSAGPAFMFQGARDVRLTRSCANAARNCVSQLGPNNRNVSSDGHNLPSPP